MEKCAINVQFSCFHITIGITGFNQVWGTEKIPVAFINFCSSEVIPLGMFPFTVLSDSLTVSSPWVFTATIRLSWQTNNWNINSRHMRLGLGLKSQQQGIGGHLKLRPCSVSLFSGASDKEGLSIRVRGHFLLVSIGCSLVSLGLI